MDVKEAITQLTGLKKYCEGMAECDESGSYVFDLDVQALDMAISTLTPPNKPLTLGLVDKYGAPLYAGDTVAADKFFMYAIRYGSHNVNPKQCEPAYQVGWYLEIVWALYNEDKTYIGHTEALYDIGGVAARYPAHCADTTEGVQNLLLYKHRPPEVSP